jgi:rare lipoprotein A
MRSTVVASDPAISALNHGQLDAVQTPPNRAVGASSIPAPATARNAVEVPVATPPGTQTYIQAGAFSNRDNAHRVRSRLSGLGPVEVRASQVDGRDYYRVRIGPLESDDQAGQLLADVIRAGYPSSHIVSE